MTQWRVVPGWDGFYEVSDLGDVRSVPRVVEHKDGRVRQLKGHTLKQNEDGKGYLFVNFCRDGVCKPMPVARAVALAFIGPRPDGLDICHSNGDKWDNRPINLRYDTRSANQIDRWTHTGRKKKL